MDARGLSRLGIAVAAVLVIDLLIGVYLVYRTQSRPVPRSEVERRLYAASEALRSGQGSERDWAAYAAALADAGDVRAAESAARRGLSAEQDSPPILLVLGRVLIEQGRRDEALSVFGQLKAAVSRRRDDLRTRSGAESDAYSAELVEGALEAARLELDSRSWVRAVEWLDVALAEDATMADALVMRARAHVALGDPDSARRDAEAALRYVPGFPPALGVLRELGAVR